jgi:hypothetical protein
VNIGLPQAASLKVSPLHCLNIRLSRRERGDGTDIRLFRWRKFVREDFRESKLPLVVVKAVEGGSYDDSRYSASRFNVIKRIAHISQPPT